MKMMNFTSVVDDITSDFNKIKKEDYLLEGKFPIIDQGQSFIGGYTNDARLVVDLKKPVIVFGDHTRIFKKIESKFAVGADGVKVLSPNTPDLDVNFLYYFLKSIRLPDAGYSRHFKFLKEIKIPVPSLPKQIEIADILFRLESLITKRKECIALLDEYLKSVFLEMFGDPVRNERGWEKVELKRFGNIVTGNTPPRNESSNYSQQYIEWIKTDNIHVDRVIVSTATEYLSYDGLRKARSVDKGALLVACIAGSIESVGRAALTDRAVSFNQQINAIQPYKDVVPLFLYWMFKVAKGYIQNHATKGMKKILTKGEFEKIKMIKPPFELQSSFETIVENTESLRSKNVESFIELEKLYISLSHLAFAH